MSGNERRNSPEVDEGQSPVVKHKEVSRMHIGVERVAKGDRSDPGVKGLDNEGICGLRAHAPLEGLPTCGCAASHASHDLS